MLIELIKKYDLLNWSIEQYSMPLFRNYALNYIKIQTIDSHYKKNLQLKNEELLENGGDNQINTLEKLLREKTCHSLFIHTLHTLPTFHTHLPVLQCPMFLY